MPFEAVPSVGTGADTESREATGQPRKFASYGRNRLCSGLSRKATTETFDNGMFGDHSHEVPIVHSILDRNRKTERRKATNNKPQSVSSNEELPPSRSPRQVRLDALHIDRSSAGRRGSPLEGSFGREDQG